jgi:hypothetical protein
MKKVLLHILFCLSAVCVSQAQGTLVVVPNEYENKDAETSSAGPPFTQDSATRYQMLYANNQFLSALPAGGWISAIAFRVDKTHPLDVSVQVNKLEIRVSTSSRTVEAMSFTFAENVGADEVVVLPPDSSFMLTSGHGGNPNPFSIRIPFTTPFFYNPNTGSLVVDFLVHQGFRVGAALDVTPDSNPKAMAAAAGLFDSPKASFVTRGGGYIAAFEVVPIPEPSPSILLLVGISTLIILRKLREVGGV